MKQDRENKLLLLVGRMAKALTSAGVTLANDLESSVSEVSASDAHLSEIALLKEKLFTAEARLEEWKINHQIVAASLDDANEKLFNYRLSLETEVWDADKAWKLSAIQSQIITRLMKNLSEMTKTKSARVLGGKLYVASCQLQKEVKEELTELMNANVKVRV